MQYLSGLQGDQSIASRRAVFHEVQSHLLCITQNSSEIVHIALQAVDL